MNELVGAEAFLSQRLGGDGTLSGLINGVWRGFAPEKTPFPFVTFTLSAAADVTGAGADARVMSKPLYLVQVFGEGIAYATLAAIANRIDALLTMEAPETVVFGGESYEILGSVRERPLSATALINGKKNEQLGGYYRLFLAGA